MQKTTIHLIRHGEVHNPEQILYGRLPGFRLSDRGREQAAAAGRALAVRPVDVLFASPQQRAQETASIIASANGHEPILTDPRIDEVHVPHEGMPLAELEAQMWDMYTGNKPPHETPIVILERVQHFIAQVRHDYAGKSLAAVTHGDIVLFMMYYANQINPEPLKRFDLAQIGVNDIYPATASITTLTYIGDDPTEIPQFTYFRPY